MKLRTAAPLLVALIALAGAARAADEKAPPAPAPGSAAQPAAATPPAAPATPGPAPGAAAAPAEPRPRERDPKQLYGFTITQQRVDRDQIIPGGPGRDGIRAVDAPTWASSESADAIDPETPVLGVAIGGEARAYLGPILEYHQLVNDAIGEVPIAVTYDPLTGAPRVWKRTVDGRTLRFGVSGLVYNSGFLMYDRETESLWSQFDGRAVSGPLAGKQLEAVPARREDFKTWLASEPKTKILIPPDPNHVDYNEPLYAKYANEDDVHFPIAGRDRRFHAKELVVGVTAGGESRAYLASLLTANGGRAEDEVGGRKIVVRYDPSRDAFEWDAPGDAAVGESYWFAWKAFHPDTTIWKDPGKVQGRAP